MDKQTQKAESVTRRTYRNARRLVRENGYYALRWLSARTAEVLTRMREQQADPLAEKAQFLAASGRYGLGAAMGCQWNAKGSHYLAAKQLATLNRLAFARHALAEKAVLQGVR